MPVSGLRYITLPVILVCMFQMAHAGNVIIHTNHGSYHYAGHKTFKRYHNHSSAHRHSTVTSFRHSYGPVTSLGLNHRRHHASKHFKKHHNSRSFHSNRRHGVSKKFIKHHGNDGFHTNTKHKKIKRQFKHQKNHHADHAFHLNGKHKKQFKHRKNYRSAYKRGFRDGFRAAKRRHKPQYFNY